MTLPVWLDNLAAYSLQIAILASVGTFLAYASRLRMPRVSLIYWQILLLGCLLLPALQSWNHPVQIETSEISAVAFFEIPNEEIVASKKPSFSITPEIIGLAIIAGACLRIVWLAFGCFRLRRFLRHSQFLSDIPPIGKKLSSRIGVQARFFISNKIDTPATFGLITPTIILPGSFLEMSEACRESIVCHELLHVRRRDWAVILVEEIIRSIYWFHPAVWWLLARIRLAREQTVDNEVVRLTGRKQPYLDSLLEIARSRGRPKAVPAPLFLKERHLVQRVALLLKEVSMNRLRLSVSVAGIAVLLAGTVCLSAVWFPLTGAPVIVQEEATDMREGAPQQAPIRVGNKVMGSKLIRKADPEYPELAKRARVSGNVIVQVTMSEEGNVSDAEIIDGHPLLSEAAVKAVKQWKFSPIFLNGKAVAATANVAVVFTLKDDKAETGSQWDVPPPPSPTAKAGGIVGGVAGGKISGGVAGGAVSDILAGKTDGDQAVSVKGDASNQVLTWIPENVTESKLIRKIEPAYPESAKRAGIEGEVILVITVDEEGSVSDAQVTSGHPLLNDAAVAAVKQWKYNPTLLNGKAVPVMATVTVAFILERDEVETGIGAGIGSGQGAGIGPGSGSGMGSGIGGDEKIKNQSAIVEGRTIKREPPRLGSKVMESKLIRKMDPIYPELARRARVSGEVKLTVTVNEEGSVSNAEVISGHPLLNDAAVDAVKQWKYSPTLLNGKPVSVMATVTVVFVLKGDEAVTGSGSDAPEYPPPDLKINIPGTVVAGKGMGPKLIRKVDPVYPEMAKRARVSGEVKLIVTVNEEGFVSDAEVISGHPFLNDAAVDSVKQWQYSPTLLKGMPVPVMAPVSVVFVLKGHEAVTGSGPDASERLTEEHEKLAVRVTVVTSNAGGDQSSIVEGRTSREKAIRVGSNVMESKLIRKVNPRYPESAKQQGVEGKVILMVTVNEEGSVSEVQHVSGHPLLIDAAVEAIKQWKYRPTLLNDKAVPVMATVTVVFALK